MIKEIADARLDDGSILCRHTIDKLKENLCQTN